MSVQNLSTASKARKLETGSGILVLNGQNSQQEFVLQGNKYENTDSSVQQQNVVNNPRCDVPKRVTFKIMDERAAEVNNDDVIVTRKSFRQMQRHGTTTDTQTLAEKMNRFLREAQERRELYDKSHNPRDKGDNRYVPDTFERAKTDLASVGLLQNGSTPRSLSSRLQLQRSRTLPVMQITQDLFGERPIIKGLVIDSVSNQQPSVVRASKYANLREEYALRQKVEGYRFACHHNLIHLNVAQRRLSTSLAQLKNKMAEYGMQPKGDGADTTSPEATELFLRNKGYVPEVKRSPQPFCFPPLTYPKRKLLTVN